MGTSPQIADRFDLTLECIRRFYDGGVSPLEETLNRYEEFFKVFQSFQGYVDFFLLNDLVNAQNQKIHFFTEIDESFHSSAFPGSVEEYLKYRGKSMEFITRRNTRIADWTATQNRLS